MTDYGVQIKIIPKDYSTTPGPTTATVNVTSPSSPSNTTSPSSSSQPNTPTPSIAATTTAPVNIDGYRVGFRVGSIPQPNEDFTGNSFSINTERLQPCTTYNVIVSAIANGSTFCELWRLKGTTFTTRSISKFSHDIIL